jgi:enoyl-CoA hydratase
MTASAEEREILFDRKGAAGLVTLNRPHALNAVSFEMVRALAAQLAEWDSDPAVTRVVITAAGGRAFSAGGDLREIYDLIRAGRPLEAVAYWRTEYRLNALIKRYRKPYVALIDGLVMGGGAGISIHGSHRVAGNRFAFAMPEAGIGFIPDVGATWFFSRMPGRLGLYCALTGASLGGADGVASGIATHRVDTDRFPDLTEALCGNVPVDAVLGAFAAPAGEGPVAALRPSIDRLFEHDTIEAILEALDAKAAGGGKGGEFARATAASMRAKSPTSLKIALVQLREGANLDFSECMRREFRIASRLATGHDLYEGIRAMIIDKDRSPCWLPAALAEITAADVQRYFAPVAEELVLA